MKVKVRVGDLPVGVFLSREEEMRVAHKIFDVVSDRVSTVTGNKAYILDDEKFTSVAEKYAEIVEA